MSSNHEIPEEKVDMIMKKLKDLFCKDLYNLVRIRKKEKFTTNQFICKIRRTKGLRAFLREKQYIR